MRRAFTLIELVIVIVIAAILLAVALPTIKYSLDESRLREGARQVNAMFASAKAHAASTGRPAGVWLELERIGDPNAATGLYQCSQLYLSEVQTKYAGDVANAYVLIDTQGPPWNLDFIGTGNSLPQLVDVGEEFRIKFDFKGNNYLARRTAAGFEIVPEPGVQNPPNAPRWLGPDFRPGVAGVDDDGNGTVDDSAEIGWIGSDDRPRFAYAQYQVMRHPERIGHPLDLPQGIVIDPNYSGLLSTNQFADATVRVLVMFNPTGDVASVSYIDANGAIAEDSGASKLYLLIGRTEQVYNPWQSLSQSNISDGGNLWVTINRRNGSIGTIENAPNVTLPINTATERATYLEAAREYARAGEVTGGQ